jgi:hypothetical protein
MFTTSTNLEDDLFGEIESNQNEFAIFNKTSNEEKPASMAYKREELPASHFLKK